MHLPLPKTILITGASSGIGAALAHHYAAAGITLILLGRDKKRLQQVAEICRLRQADVTIYTIDVTNREGMRQCLMAEHATQPIDLIIANAGISLGPADGGESADQTYQLLDVNLRGVLNTVLPLLPSMRLRGSGQIALVSSLAGLRGLPTAPAYSVSKVAVRALAEAWRPLYAKDGIAINAVLPGFVQTPLTDHNAFRMPFLMNAEKASAIIAKGLAANRPRIAFPWCLYFPALLLATLPQRLADAILIRLPAKETRAL